LTQNTPQAVWWLGSVPTHWGAYSVPPDLLAGLKGVLPGKVEREGKEREAWCLRFFGVQLDKKLTKDIKMMFKSIVPIM